MTTENKDACCAHDGKGCCNSRNIVTIVAVIVAIASLVYAFNQKHSSEPGAKPKIDTATLISGEDIVVAKLDGKPIHKSDVALAIKDLGANVPPENVDQILPAFIDQYINLALINKAADKANIDKQDDVKVQLANSRDQIIRAAYLRTLFDGKISEDTLKAAYKAKYEDQPQAEEIHARHILVDDEAKARELIAELRRGANFEELAKANSKDPSAQRGGDLGYFVQSEMVPEFGTAVFAMQPGQMTQDPIKTQFGWHIVKVEDRRQRVKPSYEEAKPNLEQEARQVILDAKLQELRQQAKVEIEDAAKPAAAAPAAGAPAADGAAPAPAGAPEAAPAMTPAPEAAPAPAPAP